MSIEDCGLSEDEQLVMHGLIAAWNAFVRLPYEHGDDLDELRHLIHAAQDNLLARPTRRRMNA